MGAIMNVQTMDDDIAHMLQREAGPIGNVDIGTAAVKGLVTRDVELLLEFDGHVASEVDPKGFLLDYAVPQSSGLGVLGVVVGGGDNVEPAVLAPRGLAPEPGSTIS